MPDEVRTPIVWDRFLGINNVDDVTDMVRDKAMFLRPGSVDFQITRGLKLELRPGKTPVITGNYVFCGRDEENVFALKNDADFVRLFMLGGLWYEEVLMYGIGNFPVSAVNTGKGVYFTNGIRIRKWVNGIEGALSGPTGEMAAVQKTIPPGSILEYWKNRLLVATGKRFLISMVEYLDWVDDRVAARAFRSNISMMKGLSGGLWVGTETGMWFLFDVPPMRALTGEHIGQVVSEPTFRYQQIDDGRVVKDSGIKVYDQVTSSGKIYDEAIMWTSSNGIFIGGKDGSYENLTKGHYNIAGAYEGDAAYRCSGNLRQYIVNLKLRG